MNSGKGTFVDEASDALVKIETAESEDNVSVVLQEILGDEYPAEQHVLEKAAFATHTFDYTEQFIQNLFPVDIRYSLSLDDKVQYFSHKCI